MNFVYVNLQQKAVEQKSCRHSWEFLCPESTGYSVYCCHHCGIKAVDVELKK